MGRLPGALFVVDSKKERVAVAEANKLGIPVVAIVDTNADPDLISVPIPGNDDAIRAVSLIAAALSDVIIEARRQSPLREAAEEGEAVTYSTETGVEAEVEGEKKKDRKSTRLNSSHRTISYAVFCLKKKKEQRNDTRTASDE